MSQQIITSFAVFIAIFLFGITIMRIGLANLGYERLKQVLIQLTDSPWKGFIVGIAVTAILQSSSAVMVITIGFVAARLLTFQQSIGIILGTNVGTVLTLEILALPVESFTIIFLLAGVFLLFLPYHLTYCLGSVSFGLGCVFLAMEGLSNLAEPLSQIPLASEIFARTNHSLAFGVGLGTLIAAIIQSSTATTAIAMGFLEENLLHLPAGIAIMFGANIGTCITAVLASIGARRPAKLVAYAHVWLNILGVIAFFPFIPLLSEWSASLTENAALALAHASFIFNVLCSLFILPFVSYFANFISFVHKKRTDIV